jgi:hypothetical protein
VATDHHQHMVVLVGALGSARDDPRPRHVHPAAISRGDDGGEFCQRTRDRKRDMGKVEAACAGWGRGKGWPRRAGRVTGELRDAEVESARTGHTTGGSSDGREQLSPARRTSQAGASNTGGKQRGKV